jgi:hypothetical protein
MANGSPAEAADRASAVMRWAIIAMLIIYITPLVLIAYEFFSTSFKEVRPLLKIFVGIAGTTDDSFAILHRALLPLMAGFAPLAFKDEGSYRSSIVIMVVLLLGILLSILLFGVFNSPEVQSDIRTHTLFPVPAADLTNDAAKSAAFTAGMAQIKGFLNRTQEAMAMYLLLMFGLKLEKAVRT